MKHTGNENGRTKLVRAGGGGDSSAGAGAKEETQACASAVCVCLFVGKQRHALPTHYLCIKSKKKTILSAAAGARSAGAGAL